MPADLYLFDNAQTDPADVTLRGARLPQSGTTGSRLHRPRRRNGHAPGPSIASGRGDVGTGTVTVAVVGRHVARHVALAAGVASVAAGRCAPTVSTVAPVAATAVTEVRTVVFVAAGAASATDSNRDAAALLVAAFRRRKARR